MAQRILLAISALALAACSTTPGLTLTATPGSIGGDGVSTVTATAKVTAGGAPAPDDTVVHFTATDGIFESMGQATPNPTATDVTPSAGAASVQLIVPRRGRGSITITATASFSGATVTQSQVITLIPSGGKATALTMKCTTQNVGGFVTNLSAPIHVLCTATAYDGNGKAIVNASIEPYAEAGHLEWITDPASPKDQFLVYTIIPGDPKKPADVDPFDRNGKPQSLCPASCINAPETCEAEPCWVENGVTHNPRDGVATLMVAVPGEDGFFGPGANGEPFVDANDSGKFEAGEAFVDVNGNGTYDDASSGQMQSPLMLWTEYRIIWSGSADLTTTGHGSHVVGAVSGNTLNNLTVRYNDRNFNKLSAVGPEDGFALGSNCTASGSLEGNAFTAQHIPFNPDEPGILFDPVTGAIDGPSFPSTYRRETDTNLQVTYGTVTINGNTAPSTCVVTASASRTYDPGATPLFSSMGQSTGESVTSPFNFAGP
jgi:hypothetical protein